jgi:Flp pilus assembly protein TadG
MRSFLKKQPDRGAALVEFAVVLPLLLLLLVGIVEFGLLFYNKQVLTNASREGARAGIAYKSQTEITQIVVNYCRGNQGLSRLLRFDTDTDPSVTVTGAMGTYGNDLTVDVSYDYAFLVPGLFSSGPTLQLTARTVMKMESASSP